MNEETEVTEHVTIDINEFPREYWTSASNPFQVVSRTLMIDVKEWIVGQMPERGYDYLEVDIVGRCAAPVLLEIGIILGQCGVDRVCYLKPGWPSAVVWKEGC